MKSTFGVTSGFEPEISAPVGGLSFHLNYITTSREFDLLRLRNLVPKALGTQSSTKGALSPCSNNNN